MDGGAGLINGSNYNGHPRQSLDLPPLERFTDWIRCVCVVTFDLELGQVIEVIVRILD